MLRGVDFPGIKFRVCLGATINSSLLRSPCMVRYDARTRKKKMGGGSLAYISALNEIEDIAYCRDWAEARVAVFGMRGDWPGKRQVPLRL